MRHLEFGRFHGEVLCSRADGGYLLCKTQHLGNEFIAAHTHRTPYFCLVLDGGFDEENVLGARLFRPGSVVLHSISDTHQDRMLPTGAKCLNIQLAPHQAARWSEIISDSCVSFGNPLSWAATKVAVAFSNNEPVSSLIDRMLALACKSKAQRADPSMVSARHFIFHQGAKPPRLGEVADHVGLHPTYLARRFRNTFGQSCGDYSVQVRVARASRLLSNAAVPLAEIALDCGFFDQSHLTNSFHRLTGLTPAAYRACYKA